MKLADPSALDFFEMSFHVTEPIYGHVLLYIYIYIYKTYGIILWHDCLQVANFHICGQQDTLWSS